MLTAPAWGFLLGWVSSMPIAGAVSAFVVQRGLAGRWRHGLALASGAALVEGLWCLLVMRGAARVLQRWPLVGDLAQLAGGTVVVGLGIYFLRRHAVLPGAGRVAEPPRRRLREDFRNGAVLVAANPLVPLNWLALVAAATALGLDPEVAPLPFAAGVSAGIVAWFTTMLGLLSSVRQRVTASGLARIMRGLGAVLVLAGTLVIWREIAHLWPRIS